MDLNQPMSALPDLENGLKVHITHNNIFQQTLSNIYRLERKQIYFGSVFSQVCTNPAFTHMINAHIYWVKGDVLKGWEEVNKAVELDPKDARYLHFRGTKYFAESVLLPLLYL
mgnify:FL=1